MRQQAPAHFYGIFSARCCQFIQKTFRKESVLRVANGAPIRSWNRALGSMKLNCAVWEPILQVIDAFQRGAIEFLDPATGQKKGRPPAP